MKALVKMAAAPGLDLIDMPLPDVGPNDVLIRIHKTAICGTDLHIWNWDAWSQRTVPIGMQVGHEFCGTIDRVGSAVTEYKPGEVVSGEGHIVCGHCRNCKAGRRHLCPNTKGIGVNRPGCFAEYLSIPQENVYRIPKEIPMEIASLFDPLGNAVHTALSWDLVGEDVLITGAGLIGSLAAAVCRHAGAKNIVVTDLSDFRLGIAKKLGATRTINVRHEKVAEVWRRELDMEEGFDVGLEMSGSPAGFHDILGNTCNGAKVSLLGIMPDAVAIDWDKVIFKGLMIKGIYGREMFETWHKMSKIVRGGMDISPIITHRLPYTDYKSGFEAMASGSSGKVILSWI